MLHEDPLDFSMRLLSELQAGVYLLTGCLFALSFCTTALTALSSASKGSSM